MSKPRVIVPCERDYGAQSPEFSRPRGDLHEITREDIRSNFPAIDDPAGIRPLTLPYWLADGRIACMIDPRIITIEDMPRVLSVSHAKLLGILASNPNAVLTHSVLINYLYGEAASERYIKKEQMQINLLRDRLGQEFGDRAHGVLRAAYGLGYVALSSMYAA